MLDFVRKTALGLGAAFVLGVSVASAATVTVIDSSTQGVGNDAGVNYAVGYGANTPTGATWSADPTWDAPPEGAEGISQSPFNNTGLENTQDYFAIGGVLGSNGALSPVSLFFGIENVQSAFTFLWGSIDSYNIVEFLLGGDSVFSFTGDSMIAMLPDGHSDGTGPNFEGVALVTFSNFERGFDTVKFTSNQAAFEIGLSPIPLPAGGLLLLGALGGLAALRRRKAA